MKVIINRDIIKFLFDNFQIFFKIYKDLGSNQIHSYLITLLNYDASTKILQKDIAFLIIQSLKMEQKPESQSPAKKKVSLTVQDFTLKHRLGKGAYGDVFMVIKNSDKKVYAMKQIQKKKLEREEKEYQAMVEKELLSTMKHPGINKLKYTFQDKANLYFIQEYCEGGEFINFIKLNISKLTEEVKIFYIAEIVNTLEYLHTNGITHRDLKPENLMLDKRGHLKLIDFGTAEITNCKLLSVQFKEHILKLKQKSEKLEQSRATPEEDDSEEIKALKKRRSTFVGTCYYISPELLEHNYCPPSADLWALGCIIYQLYYLQTPFKDSYEFAVFEKIKMAEVVFPKNESITEEAIDLIKRLLLKNPDDRLGSCTREDLNFAKLKAHPYFRGINIDNIFNSSVPFIADLQEPQKSEQQKKEAQEQYALVKEREAQIVNELKNEGKQVLKFSVLEQKAFIFYTHVLLVLCKNKELYIVSSDDLATKKGLKLKTNDNSSIKLYNEQKFEILTEERVYHFRSANAEEWVKAVQSS